MLVNLEIQFKDIEKNKEYERIIKQVVDECFKIEKLRNFYISVILTTSKNIKKINNEYRKIDKATDVLSFPMFEPEDITKICKIQDGIYEVLGDIIVSIEQVKIQAIEYGHSFERELAYMIVHGFYHLMGYDHIEEKDKFIMRSKEENVLSSLQINR